MNKNFKFPMDEALQGANIMIANPMPITISNEESNHLVIGLCNLSVTEGLDGKSAFSVEMLSENFPFQPDTNFNVGGNAKLDGETEDSNITDFVVREVIFCHEDDLDLGDLFDNWDEGDKVYFSEAGNALMHDIESHKEKSSEYHHVYVDFEATKSTKTNRIYEIIEDLKGTCDTLDDACHHYGIEWSDLTSEELGILDSEIFLCDECGWWCEVSDMSEEENVCDDCNPEED